MSQALLAGLSRTTEPHRALRRFLTLDAVTTGTNGLVYVVAPGPVGRLLGVDAPLLFAVGVFLVAYGAAVGAVASRRRPPAAAVTAVVDANVLWVVSSFAALALWLEPSAAGAVWIPAQALTVAGFAALQWTSLRARDAGR